MAGPSSDDPLPESAGPDVGWGDQDSGGGGRGDVHQPIHHATVIRTGRRRSVEAPSGPAPAVITPVMTVGEEAR